jgi:hypothetical protein
MKTNRFLMSATVAVGLAAISIADCADKTQTSAAPSPPAKDAAPPVGATTAPIPAVTVQAAATANPDVASGRWADISGCTYDQRTRFFAGLDRLEARVAGEVSGLTTRRAAMKSTANTQDWDFAMKEMKNAQSYLKSTGEVLKKASPDNWSQEKATVSHAWRRSQDAFDKVKRSTTN